MLILESFSTAAAQGIPFSWGMWQQQGWPEGAEPSQQGRQSSAGAAACQGDGGTASLGPEAAAQQIVLIVTW